MTEIKFFDTSDLKDDKIYLSLKGAYEADMKRGWVPYYSFDICLFEGANVQPESIGGKCGKRVGFCNFRIDNSELTKYRGNIGYGIDENYRGNHYSLCASKLLLKLAQKHGLKFVLINCAPDNFASNRICELLNAIYIETLDIPKTHEMYSEGKRKINVYRVDL